MMAKRVIVAVSGGVDSSVASYIMKRQGYDVLALTLKLMDNQNIEDARAVAEKLDIPHYVYDYRKEFDELVIKPFVDEYLEGRTPNPCVLCNKNIKWGQILKAAKELEGDYIATGHYARVVKKGERYTIQRAETVAKDQSYALYALSQEALSKTIFPLGGYSKDEVRQIAKDAGLTVHNKQDSQEICFVSDNYADFIREYTGKEAKEGNFVLSDGTIMGSHKGLMNYTIGQRKGLGISYSQPLFVQKLDKQANEVVLGSDKELYSKEFRVKNVNYMAVADFDEISCIGKIRYAHLGAECIIRKDGDGLSCVFKEGQRAITRGQSAVFYDSEHSIIAGGIIE